MIQNTFFFGFFALEWVAISFFISHIDYYKLLTRVLCAIQEALVGYLSYIQWCYSQIPNVSLFLNTSELLCQPLQSVHQPLELGDHL